ncbi:VCBS repeat-containing protein [Fulvivirgaceae bacterium BMA10]|uniref:VCBS repeat-containing protein n=1 Tax=Splendidivirga corallicola TaxID=3051826 RepID=A0ABT8KU36_9BACT|nr:VCBS repeat-containing protein [Fulvivirgaceae bacterium BMA10]
MNRKTTVVIFCFLGLLSCKEVASDATLFSFVPAETSNIEFENALPETADFNILNYLYYYNGGGVAVGDINGDNLEDIYFTSNLGQNRLYLNKGNLKFEDITAKAGVGGMSDWTTGVSMVDINGDGLLDIYVCNLGDFEGKKGKNELFINNGDLTFEEKAEQYGLDFRTFSTQATFLDYDNDGDLDMYLLNHAIHTINSYAPRNEMLGRIDAKTGDRLLKNNLDKGEVEFTDVTSSSGIYSNPISFGLGVATSDINADGWIDLYISNDFHENDYLYINNGDGTFTDQLTSWVGHTSKYSMGNDANDFNNDGRPDIITLDMLPHKQEVLQKSMGEDHYALREIILERGYEPQLARNTLQLNTGERFSEIAPLSGIEATDWSWTPLIADLDNDGMKDIYITNGIYRRPNDLDYLNYTSNRAIKSVLNSRVESVSRKLIEFMPQYPVSNIAYRNLGNYQFENVSEQWAINKPTHSNGAAYSDLDNDGDLDIVVNNINEKALLIENRSSQRLSKNNYIDIRLHGEAYNSQGIGAKVYIRHADSVFFQEQSPVRGFISSVSPVLHFGLGRLSMLDQIIIVWPGGKQETIYNVQVNVALDFYEKDASGNFYKDPPDIPKHQYFNPSKEQFLFEHKENIYHDAYAQFLIPRAISREGPGLAVADVDNDGLQDFYVTGASGQPGALFIQEPNGSFNKSKQGSFQTDSLSEEVCAVFFDVDADKDMDLYIVTAGYEHARRTATHDKLYLNDGSGNFDRSKDFNEIAGQNSSVIPEDYDKDGDIDLFIGGRAEIEDYGRSPRSYLLENNGSATFNQLELNGLNHAGMVSDGVWADLDGDGWKELILVGEWMPITIFANRRGQLERIENPSGLSGTGGWWNTIIAEDFDNDGDLDLIAGNIGLNTKLTPTLDRPVRLYLKDFDENGKVDPIITFYLEEKEYPLAEKDLLVRQMPFVKKKFPDYRSFSGITINELFSKDELSDAVILEANEFASLYIENLGEGRFKTKPLPIEANMAPITSMIAHDLNNDGLMDIIAGGNFHHLNPPLGRQDASVGFVGLNDGKGNFIFKNHTESGLFIEGEVRDIKWITIGREKKKMLMVARNNAPLIAFDYKDTN